MASMTASAAAQPESAAPSLRGSAKTTPANTDEGSLLILKMKCGVRSFVIDWAFQVLLEQLAMFGDSAAYSFAPHAKTGGLQLTAHYLNDLSFGESSALLDLLKRGAILPRIPDDAGDLFRRGCRFHDKESCLR